MIRSSTLTTILLYLNNFPQNKHITTLFIAHVSVLLMPVNQFSCSCEETLHEARKRTKKKERNLERWPLPQIPLFFYMYFAHFSWCINPQTEALSWLEVLLSGATTLVTGVGKKIILYTFCPSPPLSNVDKTLSSNTSLHFTIFQHWMGEWGCWHPLCRYYDYDLMFLAFSNTICPWL